MTEMPLTYGYHPGFSLSFFPTVCAGPAVSRTARLLLFNPLHNPAGCPRVRTRGMGMGDRECDTTVSDANVNTNGHRYYRPPSVAVFVTPTRTTHSGTRLERRITGPRKSRHTPAKTSNPPCPACPLFTAPLPIEERHQARNGRAGDGLVERGHQPR